MFEKLRRNEKWPIRNLLDNDVDDLDVPEWIEFESKTRADILDEIESIHVTDGYHPCYTRAHHMMTNYGDEILEYIGRNDTMPEISGMGWRAYVASVYAKAVEIWARDSYTSANFRRR